MKKVGVTGQALFWKYLSIGLRLLKGILTDEVQ
jgi:hypothetical protein